MLQHIFVKNFALIDQLELTLERGATMVTGETGAGKSIILGAIDIALGQRATSGKIKAQAKQAEVILTFNIGALSDAQEWLQQHDLESDDVSELLIRRIINSDGKSRSFINGRPSNLQLVKEISKLLVLLHSQHENQHLLHKQEQTKTLDAFADNHSLLDQIATCTGQWQTLNKRIQSLTNSTQASEQKIEFIQFQLEELNQLTLSSQEIKALPDQHKKLAHSEELIQLYQIAVDLSREAEDANVENQFNQLNSVLNNIEQHDSSVKQTKELLQSLQIQFSEIIDELRQRAGNVELDPEQLALVEKSMSMVHDMARKHRIEPEQLPEFKQQLEQEFDDLINLDNNIEELQQQLDSINEKYQALANKLTSQRQKAAQKLSPVITKLLNQLGMPQAKFQATLADNTSKQPSPLGNEAIELTLQTNPGTTFMPLNKIASGGELARTSLAIQATLAKHIHIPTLIFDEIDVGIGGKTAAVVGQLLNALSQSHQIICITHQPQVAASGQHHWSVRKSSDKKSTTVTIENLDKKQRIEEIARMLGGIEMTKHTLAHAKEMLKLHEFV
jgi:DNA repair protein RecN (Recombination protein N)